MKDPIKMHNTSGDGAILQNSEQSGLTGGNGINGGKGKQLLLNGGKSFRQTLLFTLIGVLVTLMIALTVALIYCAIIAIMIIASGEL